MKIRERLTTDEVKTMNLDILTEVADFCEKNHLRYWLYYGTLIGAIRHNGFIPWDDDIDIVMPRPDYEKLLEDFNHTSESDYEVVEYRITPGYHTTFAKVHNPKTIIETEYSNEMAFGVFIDIFPLDGIKGTYEYRKIHILKKFLSAKINKWWSKRTLKNNLGLYFFKTLLFAIPVRTILNKIYAIRTKYSYEQCDDVDHMDEIDTRIPKRCLEGNVTYHVFENRKFRIPNDYDTCLRKNYGDYMKLPPKEEQVGHPQIAYRKE